MFLVEPTIAALPSPSRTDTEKAKMWIAAARECGMVVIPWLSADARTGQLRSCVMQFGRDEDGEDDFSTATARLLNHPCRDILEGCRKGLVFDVLCAEFGVDPSDPNLCAKVNARLAADHAAREAVRCAR